MIHFILFTLADIKELFFRLLSTPKPKIENWNCAVVSIVFCFRKKDMRLYSAELITLPRLILSSQLFCCNFLLQLTKLCVVECCQACKKICGIFWSDCFLYYDYNKKLCYHSNIIVIIYECVIIPLCHVSINAELLFKETANYCHNAIFLRLKP